MQNIQKLVAFLYTNNEQSEKGFTIPLKRIKSLRMNETKEAKELFTENSKIAARS